MKLRTTLLIMVLVCLLASCKGDVGENNLVSLPEEVLDAPDGSLHVINASMGFSQWIDILDGDEVLLSELDPKACYIVRTEGSSMIKSLNTRQVSVQKLLPVADGFLPIPDSLGESRFSSQELGISNGRIMIEKLGRDNDMVIDTRYEDPVKEEGTTRIFEEYYHIDFSDQNYRDLDKSDLVILQRWEGNGVSSYRFAIVGKNLGVLDKNCKGILNLSGQTTLNLYHRFTEKQVQNPFIASLVLTNPVNIQNNTPTSITNPLEVYRISSEGLDPAKEYVLEFDKSAAVADFSLRLNRYSMASSSSIHKTRTLTGEDQVCNDNKGLTLTNNDLKIEKMVLYFGSLTEDYLFNWHYANYFSEDLHADNFGTITLREIKPDEKERIHHVEIQKIDNVPYMRIEGNTEWVSSLSMEGQFAHLLLFSGSEEDRADIILTLSGNGFNSGRFSSERGNGSVREKLDLSADNSIINMSILSDETTVVKTLSISARP